MIELTGKNGEGADVDVALGLLLLLTKLLKLFLPDAGVKLSWLFLLLSLPPFTISQKSRKRDSGPFPSPLLSSSSHLSVRLADRKTTELRKKLFFQSVLL